MTTILRALRAAADMIEIERAAFVDGQAWPDGSLRGSDVDICQQYDKVLGMLRDALEAAQREQVQDGRLIGETFDLAMLVRRLALALRKAQPDHPEISDAAMDYLRRIGHVGGVLR